MNPLYSTFEDLEKEKKKLNIGKFRKMLTDLGVELPNARVTEVFKKITKG